MSTGQRPRWREHFGRMKVRNRGRWCRRGFYVVELDADWHPAWPPRRATDTTHHRRYPHPRSGRNPGKGNR